MGSFPIEEARERRAQRAASLEKLAKGTLRPAKVLRRPPVPLLKTDVGFILLTCRGLGREGVRTILERAEVWPYTKLGDLSKEQQERIIDELPLRARR